MKQFLTKRERTILIVKRKVENVYGAGALENVCREPGDIAAALDYGVCRDLT